MSSSSSPSSSTATYRANSRGQHPYVPSKMPLPGYVPNSFADTQIVYFAGAVIFGLFLFATVFARCLRLPGFAHNVFVWLMVAAPLELAMNSFLLLNYGSIHTMSSFPAQVWKEYALADSRYLSSKNKLIYISTVLNACVLAPYMLLQIVKMIFYRKNVFSCYGCVIAISAAYLCNIIITAFPVLSLPSGYVEYSSDADFKQFNFAAPAISLIYNAVKSLTKLDSLASMTGDKYIWGYFIGLHALRAFMPIVVIMWAPGKLCQLIGGVRIGAVKPSATVPNVSSNRSRNTFPSATPTQQKKKNN